MVTQTPPHVRAVSLGILLFGAALSVVAEDAQEATNAEKPSDDLTAMSLQDLMNVEVTSVSKKKEPWREAAAAVYVITQEDIRRSGATSIPEVLRMVPGMSVGHINSNAWGITCRGFNDLYANKLLVLMDGRVVYTPLFAGTHWEERNTILEDIDRIEVIRGPGGTLWGTNAVNGIVNIITKPAKETQGGLLSVGTGTEERALGELRYGDKLSEKAYYRLYIKHNDRDDAVFQSGEEAHDNWNITRGGIRIDWEASDEDMLTFQGDVYRADVYGTLSAPQLLPPYSFTEDMHSRRAAGSILSRWSHTFADDQEIQLQLYYDRSYRNNPSLLKEERDTVDIDLQHRVRLGNRHDVVWGVSFRHTEDDIDGTFPVSLDPTERSDDLFSAFLQDEISLVQDRLSLTLGSRFEHNDYSGFEYQPSVRMAWTPNERNTLWAAVSRAVRTPARVDHHIRINAMAFPVFLVSILGDERMDSEEVLAYELGYRVAATKKLHLDATTFYNSYENLRTTELSWPSFELWPLPPHIVIPFASNNNMEGNSYGFELSADWRPTTWCGLRAAYAFLEVDLDMHAKTIDPISEGFEDYSPQQRVMLQSSFDMPRDTEIDIILRYEDELPAVDVDAYFNLDVRFGWQPRENLEFAIVGQNLLETQHSEFMTPYVSILPTDVQRSVYGKVTWRF